MTLMRISCKIGTNVFELPRVLAPVTGYYKFMYS